MTLIEIFSDTFSIHNFSFHKKTISFILLQYIFIEDTKKENIYIHTHITHNKSLAESVGSFNVRSWPTINRILNDHKNSYNRQC